MIQEDFLEEVTLELVLQLSAQGLQVWGLAEGGPFTEVENAERGAGWGEGCQVQVRTG